ncbi:MAG TPA: peptide-methionine (S)-S-oxide reductase MsrA [Burkholderiales bacterium]|nr:peptide-methionine (S)-S-oxide reductase MsrA [Burkholderiales bacterium]
MTYRPIAALALALACSAASGQPKGLETAIFAGGCFWCVESDFDKVPGVVSTTSGYTGGRTQDPTYEEVSSGSTGHAESVEIVFDPKLVSYRTLLQVYWHSIDPTVKDRQFCDVGTQYRTAIFYLDAEQKREADESLARIEKTKPFKAPIVTEIVKAGKFWPAEEYHQDFYKKNPLRYHFYREGCGRDARVKQLWGSEAGRP